MANEINQNTTIMNAKELLNVLIHCQFEMKDSVYQVRRYFPETSALEMCKIIEGQPVGETEKRFLRDETKEALDGCGYSEKEVERALTEVFPNVTNGIQIDGNYYLYVMNRKEYAFGTGDFTIEAVVKNPTSGTLISKKGSAGGHGYGGFLVVFNPDRRIKFVVDNGFGYRQVTTRNPIDFDESSWFHVLCTRVNGELKIYVNFEEIEVMESGNINTALDITSDSRLTLGYSDQHQEPYRLFHGQLANVRLWNCSRYYVSLDDFHTRMPSKTDRNLVGWWNFVNKTCVDESLYGNKLQVSDEPTYVPCSF